MSNDTYLLKQSQTTIGHLRITAHIGKLLSLFCLLAGIFYLKLFFLVVRKPFHLPFICHRNYLQLFPAT